MPPPPTKTVQQISAELNAKGGQWIRVPNLFSITTPNINENIVNYGNPTNGIILVAFLNLENSEVKLFVAKYLDVPERDTLF